MISMLIIIKLVPKIFLGIAHTIFTIDFTTTHRIYCLQDERLLQIRFNLIRHHYQIVFLLVKVQTNSILEYVGGNKRSLYDAPKKELKKRAEKGREMREYQAFTPGAIYKICCVQLRSTQASFSALSPAAFSYSASPSSSTYSSSSPYSPSSSSSSSGRSLPSSRPISSSLCLSFSLRTAFCLRILSFSFIIFSSRHFIVSISSCIFSSSSSRRDERSSASWISFSRSSTWMLMSSSWLCFQRASRGQPRACMAWRKRWFRRRRLMMLPPLRSWIFLTLFLTLPQNSLICTSYSWVSCSTLWLKVLSCASFSSDRDLFSVSSSICFLSICSQPEVMACSISFCLEFSSTILRFISARFFLDSSTNFTTSPRSLPPPRCYQNWAMRARSWEFQERRCYNRLIVISKLFELECNQPGM